MPPFPSLVNTIPAGPPQLERWDPVPIVNDDSGVTSCSSPLQASVFSSVN